MKNLDFIATTAFGLEATVKRELGNLGFGIKSSTDGRIDFSGDFAGMARANIWLRAAGRVLLKMGEFEAATFNELFDGVRALPWEDIIPKNGNFPVICKSVKSALFSVPDCQRIVKKAVAERLKAKYHVEWLEETGSVYEIQAALLNNKVTMTIDTSGAGLHKRGYRAVNTAAPIKETLAAAMIELSYWRRERPFLDPMCGSGTIAIEAAMVAKNMAPGAGRAFVSESWPVIDSSIWRIVREEAAAKVDNSPQEQIFASDIDKHLIERATANAKQAGVADCINFSAADIADISLPGDFGCMISNPPYGQRIGSNEELRRIYAALKCLFPKSTTWSVYIITADEEFEQALGRRANSRRKLFNGATKTNYYQFYGPKPIYSLK